MTYRRTDSATQQGLSASVAEIVTRRTAWTSAPLASVESEVHGRADVATHRQRGGEPDPVQPVVEGQCRAGDDEHLVEQDRQQRQGEVAVHQRRTEGPRAGRAGSTWIHWWSPVASANWSTCSWLTR